MSSIPSALYPIGTQSASLAVPASRRLVSARVVRIFLLLLFDTVALGVAGGLAYAFWAAPVRNQPAGLYLALLPLLPLFGVGYAGAGLYPGFGLGAVEILRRFTLATSFIFLGTAALVFALQVPHDYSRVTFMLLWLGALVFLPTVRFALLSRARHWKWWPESCVVVGVTARLESTFDALSDAVAVGYRPVAVLATDGDPVGTTVRGCPVFGGIESADWLSSRGIRVAIVDDEQQVDRSLRRSLTRAFRHVILLRDPGDIEFSEPRRLGTGFGFECKNELLRRRSRFCKRLLDLAVGSVGLLCALPIIAIAVAAVKVASPGPGLFRQARLGRDGKPFSLWKVRTMVPGAEQQLEQMFSNAPHLQAEWDERFKLSGDPRVVGVVGQFLRRYSIDELPQLWNVVKGEMSLVGPRPLPVYHLREFTPEQREIRQCVPPGMTGLWQVLSGGDGSAKAQQGHDEYYVRNWSIWLDLHTLFRTSAAVLMSSSNH